jgi:ferredoxin-type protein NapF
MNSPADQSRRAFLRMRPRAPQPGRIRPPWSLETSLSDHCTACGDCVTACPERILRFDNAGLPAVDFNAGACTFCGDCARICAAPVFDMARTPAWQVKISVSDQCLPKRGILCESCRDICIDEAISFERAPGLAPVPRISDGACTGCGACVSVCPAGAISATCDGGPSHA